MRCDRSQPINRRRADRRPHTPSLHRVRNAMGIWVAPASEFICMAGDRPPRIGGSHRTCRQRSLRSFWQHGATAGYCITVVARWPLDRRASIVWARPHWVCPVTHSTAERISPPDRSSSLRISLAGMASCKSSHLPLPLWLPDSSKFILSGRATGLGIRFRYPERPRQRIASIWTLWGIITMTGKFL